MATYLETINEVLKRLRETEVASVSESAYSKLIGAFINDAKREIEDAWDWTVLRSEITIACVVGTTQYTLTGTNERTRLRVAANDTHEDYLMPVLSDTYFYYTKLFTTTNSNPYRYRVRGWNTSGAILVDVWPTPSTTDNLIFECLIPQADFTTAQGATVVKVPHWLLYQRAIVDALDERGDDGGTKAGSRLKIYERNLADAIAIDAGRAKGEADWVVV